MSQTRRLAAILAADVVGGIVRLTPAERKSPRRNTRSRCGNRVSPLIRRLGSEIRSVARETRWRWRLKVL
jgi:hypothetical protein